jgi:hypothetical protein
VTNPYTLRPVTEDGYFVAGAGGRGALAHRVLENLRRSAPLPDSVSLIGERRFGKTSLLGYLRRAVAAEPDVVTGAIDLLDLAPRDASGFYALLTEELNAAGALAPGAAVRNSFDLQKPLRGLRQQGRRLVLFIDEFDVVAAERRFERGFFDSLRSLAIRNDMGLVLVVASVAPLKEIAHAGLYGSPFFNIFRQERLGLLSPEEARALVRRPPGGGKGFSGRAPDVILRLAGRHPYLLQLACTSAWELRAQPRGKLDADRLRTAFAQAARDQLQYIWDHRTAEERRALCDLVHGARATGDGLATLADRGYVVEDEGFRPCCEALERFVREQCAARAVDPQPQAPPARSIPEPVRVPAPAGPAPGRFALVVGVDRYLHARSGRFCLPELRFACQDAARVAALLRDLGFAVTELTDADATCDRIHRAFAELHTATERMPPGCGCFVFHFSGHGLMPSPDSETAYLMAHDSDPALPAARGVEMRRLVYELLPLVCVEHSLVLLDACHSGFAAGVRELVPAGRFHNLTGQLFACLRNRMVLAACAGQAQARESDSLGHGVFTHYVLRHWRDLEGDHPPGRITFGSLVDYVGRVMKEKHDNLPPPVYNGMGEGGFLVLREV